MLGFQAAGAAPIVEGRVIEHPETVATAIRIGNPASWKGATSARDESGGLIDRVTDEQILDAYRLLGARWIVVHAGYHFTRDKDMRMRAGLERLRRLVARADESGAILYLENLNKEPQAAEVHYLAHTLEEWRYYYEAIDSPSLRLSFTVNHAHLVPEGVDGFIDALDFARVGEVRLADCFRNGHEVHLVPGQGDLDFGRMFRRIEAAGFKGHYTNAFGSLDDMLAARAPLVEMARAAGVSVD